MEYGFISTCSVSDPYSLNPDPAKNLNPDLDPIPDPDPSYFLPLSEFFFFLLHNFNSLRFSHQKKLIERQNVVTVTKKLPLDPDSESGSRRPLNPDPYPSYFLTVNTIGK